MPSLAAIAFCLAVANPATAQDVTAGTDDTTEGAPRDALQDLEGIDPAAYKQAVARAYDILHQLTGEHWEPSDTAPETIDLSILEDSAI